MTSLPTLLALLLGSAVAAPWSDEAEALLNRLDAEARYELAAELAQAPATEIEAVLALQALEGDPTMGEGARALLARTLLLVPMRPGWAAVYERVADREPDAGRRYELRLMQAMALSGTRAGRARGRTVLEALRADQPDRDEADVVLGHLALLDGDGDAALTAFRRALTLPEGREGLALASLAEGVQPRDAAWWSAALVASGVPEASITEALGRPAQGDADVPALRRLLLEGTGASARVALDGPADKLAAATAPTSADARLPRADALEAWGYPLLAIRVLSSVPDAGATVEEELLVLTKLGRLQLDAGDPAAAAKSFESALAIEPGEPFLRAQLADALMRAGQAVTALSMVGNADEELRKRIEAHIDLEATRRTETRLDDGPSLRAAYAADPENPRLAGELGTWLYQSEQRDAARPPLLRALEKGTYDPVLANYYADASLRSGDPDAALEVARKAVGLATDPTARRNLEQTLSYAWVRKAELAKAEANLSDTIDSYAVAHALQPTDAGVLRGLGGALWGAGRKQQAYAVYVEAFELDPKSRDGLDGLVKLGLELDRDAELRSLLKRYGSVPAVRTALRDLDLVEELSAADAAVARGDLDDAWLRYRRLQAKAPDNPTVLRGLASISLARGDEATALELFRKARQADPDNPWSRLGEVNGLLAVGRLDAAGEILDELAGHTDVGVRDEVRRTRARLWLERGKALHEEGRDHEAFDAYRESLALDATTWTYTNLAALYRAHGQYELARAFYEAAWGLDATNVYARLGQVGLLVDRGYLEQAETLLDTLPQDHAQVVEARVRLEVVRAQREALDAHRIGEHDTARQIVRELYDRYPDSELARAAWQTEVLDLGTPEARLASARGILVNDPTDLHALGTVLDAAHALRTTATVLPLFEAAARHADATDDHADLLAMAKLAAQIERGLQIAEEGRHDDAVGLLDLLRDDAGLDASEWTLLGGAFLEVRETTAAHEAFQAALVARPDFPGAVIGDAGTWATQGRTGRAIADLDAAWQRTGDPAIGLALAELYQSRGQYKAADAVLDQVASSSAPGARVDDPLEALTPPAPYVVEPFPPATLYAPTDARVEYKRRELKERAPDGWKPGLSVGAGVYTRPGFRGEQFLTAFFIPLRLHELRAGPVSFDVEAVPYILSDAVDDAQGVLLSAGMIAGLGPVSVHLRGGVSPLGFATTPYFLWFGNIDGKITDHARIGFMTSREPVTDSLTSFAGKADASGRFFGRVHRTSFGGYLGLKPTEPSSINLFGKGGWNDDVIAGAGGMPVVGFWEAGANGAYRFKWDLWGLKVGADVIAMAYQEQVDLFEPGHGGFFSPALFVQGGLLVEGTARTRDDRFMACVGANAGPQYLDVISPSDDSRRYMSPGTFFGYGLRASLDWRMARYWWLGVDFSRIVTGNVWQQNLAMLHLHFGPNDAWKRHTSPVYSPLAGQPVVQAQPCGNDGP